MNNGRVWLVPVAVLKNPLPEFSSTIQRHIDLVLVTFKGEAGTGSTFPTCKFAEGELPIL